jgi:hypothetical protein
VGLPSRIFLPTNRSPEKSSEEAGDVKRHLHPGLSPLGSPDVASIASDIEGPRGSQPTFHGRLSDGSDDGQAASDPSQPPCSRLEDLWRNNSLQDLPGNTKDILKAGWRQSTEDRYDRAWQSFKRHLRSTNVPLDQVGVKHILNYIAQLHNLGLAYRTISLHRSTNSMTLPYVNGVAVGSHPLVSRMCKGSFEKRPPLRKVPSVWDPTPVLDIFMHWHLPLSYAQLVRKCAFILAILSGRRLSKFFNLKCNVSHLQISNYFVQLVPAYLSKTDKAGRIGPPICLKSWREDESLCPVAVIRTLLEVRDALDIQHD